MTVGREANERIAQIGRYFMRKILRYTSLIVMVFVPLRPGVVEALQSGPERWYLAEPQGH